MAKITGIVNGLDAILEHGVIGYENRGRDGFYLLLGNGSCLWIHGHCDWCESGDIDMECAGYHDRDYSQLPTRWDRICKKVSQ